VGGSCIGHSACHSYPVTHKDGIGFCQKEMSEPYTTDIALCFVIDVVNGDNNLGFIYVINFEQANLLQ
jgi:hypothetical protein